jgi:rod shape determining protein RodA
MLALHNFFGGRLLYVRVCLLVTMLLLIVIGIATLYAISHPAEGRLPQKAQDEVSGKWQKQVVFALVGLGGLVLVNCVSYRRLGETSHWLHGIVLALLALILLSKYVLHLPFIPPRNGSYRWIEFTIGSHTLPQIQPSELCKITYILAMAWYLRFRSNYDSFKALIGPFAVTLLPMILILKEPDLGTVLLMMPVLFTMLFVAGARIRHLLSIVLLAVAVSPILWMMLHDYQRERISSVLLQNRSFREKVEANPALGKLLVGRPFAEKDWRSDLGYQLTRSKLAVAWGGLTGTGYRHGPFIKYNFLPFRYTDFIFSVVAHQWGFFGSVGFFLLYIVFIACGLEIAAHNTDPFGRLLAVGLVSMFTVQAIVNIGMAIGIMPVTGLTLPFVSYGGSSLLVNMVAVGLLNNVGRCRPFSVAPRKGVTS